jgi:hypothetical protein
MASNCLRVTLAKRGSASLGSWAAGSSPTVWSRLLILPSATAIPTSVPISLLVTDQTS